MVRVEERAKGKVWVAAYFRRDGRKVRKTLGIAWVRDSGRRTARGAIIWRAGAGSKPEGYLTPKEADAALAELLHAEKRRPIRDVPSVTRKTVDDVVAAWLTHAKKVSGVSAATYRGYESLGVVMRERLGRRTEVRSLRAKDIRQLQSELLDAKLARSTVHHQMTATRAALALAKENGWIDANPADGVKIVPLPKVEPDFNVLEPSQVERVAAAVATVPDGELPRMRNGELWEDLATKVVYTRTLWADLVRIAAYTGLRIGELRALAWGDIDWKGQVLRVTRNLPATAPAGT
ncbi:tyrosine-type recombinase/integrase [Patulibacter defluvii]|uniref:tyrosine-type recombinase/integrase n=1 Tax=Patulibacter defluvii TaxID=3095358 RepID=UPI002A756DCC|nr:hypothetical protein [Patulibacter sp. DM4]